MTDKNTTEYLERLGSVRLSSDTKARMREELSAFADFHAVSTQTVLPVTATPFNFIMHLTRPLQAALALVVLLVGTTGVSLGAQDALPGDVLYGIKVNVQEKIQASLVFDADAQAKVQADIFAERLREARALVLEGKRDIATSYEMRTAINAQREKTLASASVASAETEASVKAEVVERFTTTQKILTAPRNVFATASGMDIASTPSSDRSFVGTSAHGGMGGGFSEASTLTADAKMMPEYAEADSVVEGDLILPLLSDRVAFLQTALLENTVEVSPEIKSEIEKDLNRALMLWYGVDQERSYELVSYIETFLGISLEGTQQTDVQYPDMGIDGIQIEPMPMPMPSDTGVYTEPGFGVGGNAGIQTGGDDIDLMYTQDVALPFESGVTEMGIEVQTELQVGE